MVLKSLFQQTGFGIWDALLNLQHVLFNKNELPFVLVASRNGEFRLSQDFLPVQVSPLHYVTCEKKVGGSTWVLAYLYSSYTHTHTHLLSTQVDYYIPWIKHYFLAMSHVMGHGPCQQESLALSVLQKTMDLGVLMKADSVLWALALSRPFEAMSFCQKHPSSDYKEFCITWSFTVQ